MKNMSFNIKFNGKKSKLLNFNGKGCKIGINKVKVLGSPGGII